MVEFLESEPHHLPQRFGRVAAALEVGLETESDAARFTCFFADFNSDEPGHPHNLRDHLARLLSYETTVRCRFSKQLNTDNDFFSLCHVVLDMLTS